MIYVYITCFGRHVLNVFFSLIKFVYSQIASYYIERYGNKKKRKSQMKLIYLRV